MATGLGVLRHPPSVFWSMTPRELAAAVRGLTGTPSRSGRLDRTALDALMQRHPDTPFPHS
ncbi:MAG: phage tail assembly chaperone [Hyphomicrobiaceae bacterium]